LLIGVLIPVAGYFAIKQEREVTTLSWIAFLLLISPVALLCVILFWKNITAYQKLLYVTAGYTLFNIVALHIVYPTLYSRNPVSKTIGLIEKRAIYSYKPISKGHYYKFKNNSYSITEDEGEFYNPAYNFYLNEPVKKIFNADTLHRALIVNPNAVVIARADNESDLQKLNLLKIAEHHDLFELSTTVLYVSPVKP
jgi:hypothetical protein